MTTKSKQFLSLSRRSLLGGAAAIGTASVLRSSVASEANPDNLPPNVPEWTPYLGAGVDASPYGVPSEFESHVIRRNVEWLTASTESSVNFTPLHELDGINRAPHVDLGRFLFIVNDRLRPGRRPPQPPDLRSQR